MKMLPRLTLLTSLVACSAFADEPVRTLTVCADPGNMPLSNNKGEGFENQIAQAMGKAIGADIHYYWHPSIERGLMRTTLSEGNCDLWMDMATDTEGAVLLEQPLYRSTFVFVYRRDRNYGTFKSLDDPRLEKLRIGAYQMSAVRQALAQHGIQKNIVVHYLTHDGDLIAEDQPSYQVRQVIDGKLDLAAVWGPMAGWYDTVEKAPIVIEPLNTIDSTVPLEFNMTLAVARGKPDVKAAVEKGLRLAKNDIRAILDRYGVPLVQCADCLIDGSLPSHGEYKPQPQTAQAARDAQALPRLKQALANGANPQEELGNAILAHDPERVAYLLDHGAKVNARSGLGFPPLVDAVRFGYADLVAMILKHDADPNIADISHWTPLMYAAWNDDAQMIATLVRAGAKPNAGDEDGLTPLGVTAQNGKLKAAVALIEAGADVNQPAGKGAYSPLTIAVMAKSEKIADLLIAHHAQVNAVNAGGVTPLMAAAANDAANLVSLLLAHGADPAMRSEDGRTALSIARSNNSEGSLKLLQQAAGAPDARKAG